MKKCQVTKLNQKSIKNKRRSSAGLFNTSSAGAVTSLILWLGNQITLFGTRVVFPCRHRGKRANSRLARLRNVPNSIILITIALISTTIANQAHATTSTLTISITDSVALDIMSTSSDGNFATSDTTTNNISIKTTNGTGYELGIKASTNNSNALINSSDSSKTIPSITVSGGIDESTYSSSSTYNNTWGYRPSKLNSSANSNYLQAPTSSSTITTLDKTSASNPSTANTYNLAIGARANNSTTPGKYSNTFVLTVVANPAVYSITYNQNTTDTVSDMPSNVSNQQTNSETVAISSTTPTRSGYNFNGWCTVAVADGASCTGTSYTAGGNWTIDQTLASNSLSIYAMWESAGPVITNTTCSTPVTGITYMQELADSTKKATALSNMTQGSQYVLVDKRDNQGYCVAKQADGNIWMTQNLDLDIGGANTAALTSENTDLTTSGSAPYVDGYSTSGGVITWSPASTAYPSGRVINGTSVSGWTDSATAPYSAEGGDRYYYTTGTNSNETMQTLAQCTAVSGRSEELCAHYHSGNYYNWTAAIASNASSGIGSTQYAVAANSICPKGWKLPRGRASSNTSTTRQFGYLWQQAGITSSLTATSYATDGFNKIRTSPLFFVRGGNVYGSSLNDSGSFGYYWSSSVYSTSIAYGAYFYSSDISSAFSIFRDYGQSMRCVVR